ncbi:hypothetical protein GCM10023187_48500 [Nibrella viscosa]|uniref:Helix-turn-helix domain-containing protein n=1 Tax=Nibrella viscosa TaxID=1084524 RepID=A0ABP8KU72_9BACT
MLVDFQKLAEDVSGIKDMLLTLTARLDSQQPATAPPADEIFTVGQAAKFLDLTTATVYGLVWERKIPFAKQGKRLYFSRQELTEWVRSGRQKTSAELTQEARQLIEHRQSRRTRSKEAKSKGGLTTA